MERPFLICSARDPGFLLTYSVIFFAIASICSGDLRTRLPEDLAAFLGVALGAAAALGVAAVVLLGVEAVLGVEAALAGRPLFLGVTEAAAFGAAPPSAAVTAARACSRMMTSS